MFAKSSSVCADGKVTCDSDGVGNMYGSKTGIVGQTYEDVAV